MEREISRGASVAARTASAVMLEMRGSVLMRMSLLRETGSGRGRGWVVGGRAVDVDVDVDGAVFV